MRKELTDIYPVVKEKIIRVRWKNVTASAVWEKRAGLWHCVFCAPILGWMLNRSPEEVRDRLLAMGAKWEWLDKD